MINVNATLVLQIIQFLILLFILDRLMFRPLMKVMENRSRHIDEKRKQLSNLKEETEELVNKCRARERHARKEAGESNSQIRKEAKGIADSMLKDTKDEVAQIKAEAIKEVENKVKEAQHSLKTEAEKLSEELTLKIIGRRFAN